MEAKLRVALNRHPRQAIPASRSRAMSAIRGSGNRSTEGRLRAALVQAQIAGWRLNPRGVIGVPDFWFPDCRVAVFVDGCFWHGCRRCGHYPKSNAVFWRLKIDGNRLRDRRVTRILRGDGVRVVRIWEHEVRGALAEVVLKVRGTLARQAEA
jgi:DNA mismatch endonuclease (patch repair protein)